MKDRVPAPGLEGRMQLKFEDDGTERYAKVSMADSPSEEGTPLNKSTLLTDETAAALGILEENPTPEMAFKIIGEKAMPPEGEHIWHSGNLTITSGKVTPKFVSAIPSEVVSHDVTYDIIGKRVFVNGAIVVKGIYDAASKPLVIETGLPVNKGADSFGKFLTGSVKQGEALSFATMIPRGSSAIQVHRIISNASLGVTHTALTSGNYMDIQDVYGMRFAIDWRID